MPIKTQIKDSYIKSEAAFVQASVKANDLVDFPKFILPLFYLFSAYLVLPIVDIPLLGLSISAPLMFIITIPCIFKPARPWFRAYQKWIILAILIWFGIVLSTLLNGAFSFGTDIDNQGLLSVIQYAYWLLVFVITVYITSQGIVLGKISIVLGWSIFLLALLRWGEYIFRGNAVGRTYFLTQNDYGFLFSSFSPFLLYLVFSQHGWKRFFAILGNLALWGAVVINGSRGSWVAIMFGLGLTLMLFFFRNPRKFASLLIFLLLLVTIGILAWNLTPQISSVVQFRFESLLSLEEDKSALIREAMVQKGISLFSGSPIIGVGSNRFRQETVVLNLPRTIAYLRQSEMNRTSAHNSYIQWLAEFGLVGSIPFAILLLILITQGLKKSLNSLKDGGSLFLMIFIGFIQMSVHMWVISAITNSSTWFIYGLMGGMVMSSREESREKCA